MMYKLKKEQERQTRVSRQLRLMQGQIDAVVAHHIRKHAEDYGVQLTDSYVTAVSFGASGAIADHLDSYLVACNRSRIRNMDRLVELNHLTNQFGGVQQLSIYEGGAGAPPNDVQGA